MWSLTSLFFDRGRHTAPIAPPPPMAISAPLTLTIERTPGLTASLVEHTLDEANTIWHPLGLSFTWHFVDAGDARQDAHELRVIFTDAVSNADAEMPLGWIRFFDSGVPEPIVHLSREAARRLLSSTSTMREMPLERQNTLLARVLGRAFAHELGHYLLASKSHSDHGLMRRNFSVDALTSVERIGFELCM